MDVTKNNFEEALPLIEESIRNCDFIAFDAEFSGKSLRLKIHYCFVVGLDCCVSVLVIRLKRKILLGISSRLEDGHNDFDSP